MVGGAIYENAVAEVAVPPAAVTTILPDEPKPTLAVICVDEFTVKKLAGVPPKLTSETP